MSILQDLNAFYDRLDARGEAPSYGYSSERIGFEIVLDGQGCVVTMAPLGNPEDKKSKGKFLRVPKTDGRTSGVKPFFLWDKTAYLLGLVKLETSEGIEIGQGKRTAKEHAAFKALHEEVLAKSEDPGLQAVLAFLRTWTPESFTERGFNPDLIDGNGVFRLDGDRGPDGGWRYVHDRPAARDLRQTVSAEDSARWPCLVTGRERPIARLHTALKGVSGAQSSGASLVSFNLSAFDSYGLKSGENAPVSEDAMFRYTAALNWLLSRAASRSVDMDWAYRGATTGKKREKKAIRQNFTIADTTVVFWASAESGHEQAAERTEEVAALAVGAEERAANTPDADQEDAGTIRDALARIAAGQAASDSPLDKVEPETRIHLLGLAPNNARIAVRFYITESFGALARNIEQHMRDLTLEPQAFKTKFPQVYQLLYETAAQHKRENIPPRLGGEVMEAVLTGGRYPRTLLTAVIERIRADKTLNGPRAALIKAYLVREMRMTGQLSQTEEDTLVGLNRENEEPGYLLGRLFATYTYAESSVARRNATLRDKYIGAASATPQRVFPTLMRGYEHNRSNLLKGGHGGAAVRCDKEISEIKDKLSDEFPRTLPPEQQGRFFVGFYHQERFFYTKSETEDTTLTARRA